MNKSRHHQPQRRLAIEHFENRLMLSGDGYQSLDTDTFNLDPIANDYAVISNDAVPQVNYLVTAESLGVAANVAERIKARDEFGATAISRLQYSWAVAIGNSSPLELSPDQLGASLGWRYQIYPDAAALEPASDLDASDFRLQLVTFGTLGATVNGSFADFGRSISLSIEQPSGVGLTNLSIETSLDPTIAESTKDILSDVRDVVATIEPIRSVNAAPAQVIAPAAPANSIVTIGYSDAQVNVGAVIDELLNSGVDFDQALPDDINLAGSDDTQYTGAGGTPQTDSLFDLPSAEESAVVASAGNQADEGGMIPIQGIVGQLAGDTAPTREPIAADHIPAEISGELARVAVMELIEGEADPAAPQQADHTLLVATNDATITPERITLDQNGRNSAALATVGAVAEQAGLAASLVAPANPFYLSAMISAANDAFTAAAMSAPLAAADVDATSLVDARSEAFSQWDDAPQRVAADDEAGRSSYGYLPLIGALAVERVIAARKRKQTAAAAPPLPVR